jgi:allantoicase
LPEQPFDFTRLVNLASPRLGASVMSASDEFFTEKEAVLLAHDPVRDPTKSTERGRWVDGWLTRRRRQPGFEWLTLTLAQPGLVEGCEVDFRHLDGDHPESLSIDACMLPLRTPVNRFTVDKFLWTQIMPAMWVAPNAVNRFEIHSPYRYTHLRFNLHPDGGIARLKVWGVIVRERLEAEIDLAALENGAYCDGASDETFGPVHNMLMPGRPEHYSDGWHTRRLRGEPGFEWADIQLPAEGLVRGIELDTAFHRGDFPEHASLEDLETGAQLLDLTALRGNLLHRLQPARSNMPTSRVRLRIYPDGGVARFRLLGNLTERGREAHRLILRNTLPPPNAVAWFEQCLPSEEWARQMTSARPFASMDQMGQTGEQLAELLGLNADIAALRTKLQL